MLAFVFVVSWLTIVTTLLCGLKFTLSETRVILGTTGKLFMTCNVTEKDVSIVYDIQIRRETSTKWETLAFIETGVTEEPALKKHIVNDKDFVVVGILDKENPLNTHLTVQMNIEKMTYDDARVYRCEMTYKSNISKTIVTVKRNATLLIVEANNITEGRAETRSGTPEFTYKSPVAIDIALKEEELELKRCELRSLETAYDEKCEMYNLNIIKDKSKKRCTNCHLRTNHTQRSCGLGQCEDVRQCGELDFHHEEKTTINELIRRKQNVEKDIKTIELELKVKKEAHISTAKTFERQIRDFVINSNPEKYLVNGTGPGVINEKLQADIAILKKHYSSKVSRDLERESHYFQTVIAQKDNSYRKNCKLKNPVEKRLETNPIFPVRFPKPTATVGSQDKMDDSTPFALPFDVTQNGHVPTPLYFPFQFMAPNGPPLHIPRITTPFPVTTNDCQRQSGQPLPGAPPLPPSYEDVVPTSSNSG